MSSEKRVSYTHSASYYCLNQLSDKTKNVWLVFHGMGYLSKYFLRYFTELDSEENYIIAPQAPSKYYIGPDNKHVGASWLTREDTSEETKNILKYVDEVWKNEMPSNHFNFIVLGYSQGVSIAMRWLASRKIQCDHLILHSGGIPQELTHEDFQYLNSDAEITLIYGDRDQYITETRLIDEKLNGKKLFGSRLKIEAFHGKHQVNIKFLQDYSKK